MNPSRYRWNGKQLIEREESFAPDALVADSFLISNGAVVAYEYHRERFVRSAERQGLVFPVTDFWQAVTEALPAQGDYFPRIELTTRGELELWIRDAPPRGRTITVMTSSTDPRVHPHLKGPDLPALAQLREHAISHGADEAVIVDNHSHILDGATTCLLWWRDGTLFTPPIDAARLDSITEKVVLELAKDARIPIDTEWATPHSLIDTQIWAVNSLHGIRAVTTWLDESGQLLFVLQHEDAALDTWRGMYRAQFKSVKN